MTALFAEIRILKKREKALWLKAFLIFYMTLTFMAFQKMRFQLSFLSQIVG